METPHVFIEEVARLTAKGLEIEDIARQADLDLTTVRQIQAHPDFDKFFEQIDPDGFAVWRQAREDQIARQRVMSMAREDAPEHYRMLRELARNGDMKDAERASLLERLVKIAGVIQETGEEIVRMSPAQLQLLAESLNEIPRN